MTGYLGMRRPARKADAPAESERDLRVRLGELLLADAIDFVLARAVIVGLTIALGLLGLIVAVCAVMAVLVLLGGRAGATVGEAALALRVIGRETGAPVGYRRTALRLMGRDASAIPLYAGYVAALHTPEGRTWHDRMAGAVVVPADGPGSPIATR